LAKTHTAKCQNHYQIKSKRDLGGGLNHSGRGMLAELRPGERVGRGEVGWARAGRRPVARGSDAGLAGRFGELGAGKLGGQASDKLRVGKEELARGDAVRCWAGGEMSRGGRLSRAWCERLLSVREQGKRAGRGGVERCG
jgi:hypothetical protein